MIDPSYIPVKNMHPVWSNELVKTEINIKVLKFWFNIFQSKLRIFRLPSKGVQFVGNKAKGRISKRVFQEHKARQISRKTNISTPPPPLPPCAYQGVRNVRFPENVACFVILKHPFWDSPFCRIADELR